MCTASCVCVCVCWGQGSGGLRGEDSRHDLLEALQCLLEVVVVLMAGVCVLDEVWEGRGEGRCRGSRREGEGEQRGVGGGVGK